MHPGGQLIAFSPAQGKVRLCECETGRVVANLTLHEPLDITWLCFSPDGTRLAYTAAISQVGVWDLHELRVGLTQLGLDGSDLPERSGALPPLPGHLHVSPGSELPPPERWTQNWLRLANYEASDIGGGLADAITAATRALQSLREGAPAQERARILGIRAGFHRRNRDMRAVRDDLLEAHAIAPNLPAAALGLSRLHLFGPPEFRDSDRAFALLAPLANRDKPEREVMALLGIAQVRLGRHREALNILDKLAAEDRQPIIDYGRALGLHKLDRKREAKEMFATAKAAQERLDASLTDAEREDLASLRAEVESVLSKG